MLTQQAHDVVTTSNCRTSMRHNDVVSTLVRRHFDAMCPLVNNSMQNCWIVIKYWEGSPLGLELNIFTSTSAFLFVLLFACYLFIYSFFYLELQLQSNYFKH